MPGEFDLIERIFRDLTPTGADVLRGIGDDCGLLRVPAGQALALTTDTLVEDVHYPADTRPADIGWKALACSLSDLAAAGARPAWATLSLVLPRADEPWLAAFARGFGELAGLHGTALIGGDLVRGPVTVITVQAGGHVRPTEFLGRDGAGPGDAVYVSGRPGEAAAALALGDAGIDPGLRARLDRPVPRVELGLALRGVASACIDVSDGLAADLGHVLRASGVGACIEAGALPASAELAAAGDRGQVLDWMLRGGDDYELCFCVPQSKIRQINKLNENVQPVSCIGIIEHAPGLRLRDDDGNVRELVAPGHDHFGAADD